MYRRPKFLEILLQIRQEMARESDYDVDLFAEMIRSGKFSKDLRTYDLNEKEDSKKSSENEKKKSKETGQK